MKTTQLQTLAANANGALPPAQRKFNQLLKRLDEARDTLAAWDTEPPAFASAYAARARPLWAELLASDTRLAERLARLLDGKVLSKPEQRQVHELISTLALDVLERPTLAEAERSHWRSVHDAHAETRFDELQAEELALLRDHLAHLTGFDLGDRVYRDEAELMDDVHARRTAAQAASAPEAEEPAAQAPSDHGRPPPQARGRKPTAAQLRRKAEEAAAQAQAQQSLRTVFRKLASALHPDRAENEHDRTRRTALMQRVNEAYGREDLLALYALQLETEQVDAAHIAAATAAQLGHFTRLLQAQVAELQSEIDSRAIAFCHNYQLQPARLPKPTQLARVLDDEVLKLRRLLMDNTHLLRELSDPTRAKHWLREMRRQADFY
jgi:hypothetical protein